MGVCLDGMEKEVTDQERYGIQMFCSPSRNHTEVLPSLTALPLPSLSNPSSSGQWHHI